MERVEDVYSLASVRVATLARIAAAVAVRVALNVVTGVVRFEGTVVETVRRLPG